MKPVLAVEEREGRKVIYMDGEYRQTADLKAELVVIPESMVIVHGNRSFELRRSNPER